MAEEKKSPEVELDTDGVNEETIDIPASRRILMKLLKKKKMLI